MGMGIGSWVIFFMAMAAWWSIRFSFVLTENHRAIMWIGSVSLMLLPAFIGDLASHPLVPSIWWPLWAGVMAGEFLWTKKEQRKARKAREEREAKERVEKLAKTRKRSKSGD